MNRLFIRIVIVFILATFAARVSIEIINPFYGRIFKDPSWYPVQHTAELIQYIIDKTPREKLANEITYLNGILDRRLEILSADDKSLSERVKQKISEGGLVYDLYRDGEKRFFAPVHNKTGVVVIDPSFQQYSTVPNAILGALVISSMILITIVVGFWYGFSIRRRLNNLEAAAKKIRQGDIGARVRNIKADLIGDVEKGFNHMAERIQSLIMHRQNILNTVIKKFRAPVGQIEGYLDEFCSDPEANGRYEKIDGAIDEIELIASDLLTQEKNRLYGKSGLSESSIAAESCDDPGKTLQENIQLKKVGDSTLKRSRFRKGTLSFILRTCLVIFCLHLFHQLLSIAAPRLEYKYTHINPSWYPVHTMAALIQRAVDVTPEQELRAGIELLENKLKRKIDLVSSDEVKKIFVKTSQQEFTGRVSFGIINGRDVFTAPVSNGSYMLIVDNPLSLYRQKINLNYYAIVLVTQFILTLLFGIFLSLPIIRNLKKLMEGVERLQIDDLPVKVDIPEHNPIGDLARQFNEMSERIRSLLDDQQQMTRALVHEIRTPISRMRFYLEMLMDTEDKQGIQKQIVDIKKEIAELNLLIKELSAFTALDALTDKPAFEPVYVHQRLLEIYAQYQKTNPLIRIYLHNDQGGENAKIYAHPTLFKMAVQNILSNAIRHAQSRVDLHYNLVKDRVLIEICDDGPGIPHCSRETVFEPFTRLDNSRNRRSGGFGLGLAIVKQIVMLHGGSVTIEDNHPCGARTITYWPVSGHLS